MIKLYHKAKTLPFSSLTWSGTDNQASRQITFTLPSNPYDKNFNNPSVKLGDIVQLYDGDKELFVGVVTTRERTAEVGVGTYTARDFMHYLLKSNMTKSYKNKSPEKIVTSVCTEVGVKTTKLAKTGANIKKMVCENMSCYDIMIKAYRKAKAKTGKKYMPVMVGKKVSVVVKGTDCGVTLDQTTDITSATYTDSTDNMVNLVKIYNNKRKKKGQVKHQKDIKKYGVYQQIYTKEKGVDAKSAARAMLVSVTEEATVEAIGNIKCVAGKAVKISDKALGLTGKFYITGDTHTFQNGIHTMTLELSWTNTMEVVS